MRKLLVLQDGDGHSEVRPFDGTRSDAVREAATWGATTEALIVVVEEDISTDAKALIDREWAEERLAQAQSFLREAQARVVEAEERLRKATAA